VPPPASAPLRPGRLITSLVVLIVIMLLGILTSSLFAPASWHKRFKVELGLDLSGGTAVTLKAQPPASMPASQFSQAMNTAVSIMNSRVNGAGFTGATVVPQGSNLITVTVPGKNYQQVTGLVGTTAQLRFRQVLLVAPNYATSTPSRRQLATTTDPSGLGQASLLTAATKAEFDRLNCADKNWQSQIYGGNPSNFDNPNTQIVTCYQGQKYALDKSTVTGAMLRNGGASAQLQPGGQWYVDMTFDAQGAQANSALTTRMYDNYFDQSTQQPSELDYFAIVLDGVPQSIAYVKQPTSATSEIQGSFSQGQANTLVDVLNYGALPLTFVQQSVQSITAQVGSSQLHAGLFAAAIGLFLVVCYSFLYYRGLGIVSISSLTIAALLSYLSVVLLSDYEKFALDLAGIAGLIVAIGITADSFVVFFERLRDEVREGRTLRTALERGWVRARRTILVSDSVSFIAAAVLYKLSVGDVRDFGFTLGLTTLIDIIVVFLFTKPMVTLLSRTEFFGAGHKLSGLDPARLGARSPWRGSRRPVRRPATGGASPAAQPRTNPGEA
jgi:preprotein translocase subunit SecD